MWQSDTPEELESALNTALAVGYRHFDTAWGYRNEDVFGRVLKKWFAEGKVKREELFIVTKVTQIPGLIKYGCINNFVTSLISFSSHPLETTLTALSSIFSTP